MNSDAITFIVILVIAVLWTFRSGQKKPKPARHQSQHDSVIIVQPSDASLAAASPQRSSGVGRRLLACATVNVTGYIAFLFFTARIREEVIYQDFSLNMFVIALPFVHALFSVFIGSVFIREHEQNKPLTVLFGLSLIGWFIGMIALNFKYVAILD